MIMFESMGEEMTGIWRTLPRSSQTRNLYSPSNLIRAIKLRSIGWAGSRARIITSHISIGNSNEKARWEKCSKSGA
jgi:hypothetical protein